VIGSTGDDSDLDPILWVPASEPVEDVDILPRVEVINSPFTVDLEGVLASPVSIFVNPCSSGLTPS